MDLAQQYLNNIGTEEEIQADFLKQTENRFLTKKIVIDVTRKQLARFVRQNGIEFSRDLRVRSEPVGAVFAFINKKKNQVDLNVEIDQFLLPEGIDLSGVTFDILGDLSIKMGFGGSGE